jgi:hypothetical protein
LFFTFFSLTSFPNNSSSAKTIQQDQKKQEAKRLKKLQSFLAGYTNRGLPMKKIFSSQMTSKTMFHFSLSQVKLFLS